MKLGKKIKGLIKDSPIAFSVICLILIGVLFNDFSDNQTSDLTVTIDEKQNVFSTMDPSSEGLKSDLEYSSAELKKMEKLKAENQKLFSELNKDGPILLGKWEMKMTLESLKHSPGMMMEFYQDGDNYYMLQSGEMIKLKKVRDYLYEVGTTKYGRQREEYYKIDENGRLLMYDSEGYIPPAECNLELIKIY